MLFLNVEHPYLNNTTETLNIVPLGDLHIGDPAFDEKKLQEKISWIKDTQTIVVLTGDCINNGLKSSVTNCYEEVLKPSEQVKYLVNILTPIKERIVAGIEGNHERRTTKEVDQSPTEHYCERLGVHYCGDEVLLKFLFGRNAHNKPICYSAYATHGGGGGGNTPGNAVNMSARLGQIVYADMYFNGHTHKIDGRPDVCLIPDMRTEKVNEIETLFVSTGGFLQRRGYPVHKAMKPLRLGAPTVILSGKTKKANCIV